MTFRKMMFLNNSLISFKKKLLRSRLEQSTLELILSTSVEASFSTAAGGLKAEAGFCFSGSVFGLPQTSKTIFRGLLLDSEQ